MKAALFRSKDEPLSVEDFSLPVPKDNEVLIKLAFASLNHRDLWLMKEHAQLYPDGLILGSDGSGIVVSVGKEVDPSLLKREVIINPSNNWGNNLKVQGENYSILGLPEHGTFAEYIVSPAENVYPKPKHLSLQEAATIPLSALTAYRALFSKAQLQKGEKVLITGIGGGAAIWLLQFAVASQAHVYVSSSDNEKLSKALALGAKAGFNYHNTGWVSQAKDLVGGFDVIIDSAGGRNFNDLLELASPGGRIVNFGRTAGNDLNISARVLFWKQLSIFGTTMGTKEEFAAMISFLEKHQIKPLISHTYELVNINEAFQQMQTNRQFGKIVVKIN